MAQVWTEESKFQRLLAVELAVAEVQAQEKIIPKSAFQNIKKKAQFSIQRISEIEAQTRHDVIAFVSNLAENVGVDGKYIHYGLTSSDVLDTATSLAFLEAIPILMESYQKLEKNLERLCQKHMTTVCVGRTHGIHAEPTTFGIKMSGHLVELQRARARLEESVKDAARCKLSGPVGTYSLLSEKVEAAVAKKLKLKPEVVATQVIPRDRHAEVIFSLSLIGAAIERLSIELRHLQRTEVAEIEEGFSSGQKGSSAMPHKKNPISAENLTGISRLIRSMVHPAIENIALWHERDISHSSVERVIFMDAFILADYALDRMATVIKNLVVQKDRMKHNLFLTHGQIFSSRVLLALIKKGLSREEAYKLIQKSSHNLDSQQSLEQALLRNKEIREHLKATEIKNIFALKDLKYSYKNRQ